MKKTKKMDDIRLRVKNELVKRWGTNTANSSTY